MKPDPNQYPCGHPRTVENTRSVGAAGVRCKQCRREIDRRHIAKKAGESPNA